MLKPKKLWWLVIWVLIACGPDTIFLRPGLDTPSQHVSNGYTLMEQNKFNDAGREFQRAIELNPRFTEAHVGLGLAYAQRGEIDKAIQSLNEARALAKNEMEWDKVQSAYEELRRIQKNTGVPAE